MSSGKAVMAAWAASARAALAARVHNATHGGDRPGSVLVTGSSGKGTTCRMLAGVLRAARLHPVLAAEGARPWSGVASALIDHAEPGSERGDRRAIKLVDVDAGALPHLVRRVPRPAALVCTNILGDQRDEEDGGAGLRARLEHAIRSLPASTALILNADDPWVADLAPDTPNPRLYFGISDPVHARVRRDRRAELPGCPRCGDRLSYTRVYYAHLGHWACGGCGLSRPEPDVSVTNVGRAPSSGSRICVVASSSETVLDVPLPGIYNVYNALAAATVATCLDLPAWSLRAIESVSGGRMRMERTRVAGHDVYLALATNATGYIEVLRAILGDAEPRRLLLGLSARRYPRSDVSWIWDVDFEALAGLVPAPVVFGNRAAELAVRIKYAGWLGDGRDRTHAANACVEPDPIRAIRVAIAETPPGQPLWIVSTATALAEIHRWLHHHDRDRDPRAAVQLASPTPAAPRLIARRLTAQRPTGTQPPGPQPSGPPRLAPQPAAPPLSRHRPDRGSRHGRTGRPQPGQAGAAR